LPPLLNQHCKKDHSKLSYRFENCVYRTPWRDDETTLIDRFDVRSHLDIIDEYALRHQQNQQGSESVLFQIFSVQ